MIAAINGPAVGAGACIALAADVRIGSENAEFTVPFLKLGMHPGMATTYPGGCGSCGGARPTFTGRVVGAKRMLELGLISELLPADSFGESARGWSVGGRERAVRPLTKSALLRGGDELARNASSGRRSLSPSR